MEKISVIIPIYNSEKYLSRCIESIINQSYKNLEIILINDGSRDNSLNIINKYAKIDDRIIVINKDNSGVSDTRNIGIKKSTGKYICFCDSDDIYDSNYVEIMYKIVKEKNVSVVKCNYKVIDENNNLISSGNVNDISDKVLNSNQIKKTIIPKCLDGSIPCYSCLIMIDKDKLNTKYPTDIAMMEDVVFYLKLLLSIDNMYVISDKLYTIMYNSEGATNNVANYKRNILNVLDVNLYIKDELKKNNLLNEDNIEKLNTNHLNAISDFIFKHYLYSKSDTICLCKEIRTNKLITIINETNLKKINIQRRIILLCIIKKHYLLLRIFFILRKIIFKMRRD